MKLSEIQRIAVEAGIEADIRDRSEIERSLAERKKAYDKLDTQDRRFFDMESLANPYSDTRIGAGDPDAEIGGMLVGVDIEVGEVVLADRLRELGRPIDLLLAHHPEGLGYATLHEVMYMQADVWAAQGVGIGLADNLIAPRAEEIRRRIMPRNHYRAVDAAKLLGLAYMSCHTPADNAVTGFVQAFLDERAPRTLDDVVRALQEIPEYADAATKGYGPSIVQGTGKARAGKAVVDMTGGTEGPKEALGKLSAAGVDTLVGMHYSEEHRTTASELGINLVVAGHISSDVLGMNLVLDRVQAVGTVEIVCCSGMVRVRR